jgi:hypothetical protein
MSEANVIRAAIICTVLCMAVMLFVLPGCTGAYRMQQPLGPLKGDRLPVCDQEKKNCERT